MGGQSSRFKATTGSVSRGVIRATHATFPPNIQQLYALLKNSCFHIPVTPQHQLWQGLMEEELGHWNLQYHLNVELYMDYIVGGSYGREQELLATGELKPVQVENIILFHEEELIPLSSTEREHLEHLLLNLDYELL